MCKNLNFSCGKLAWSKADKYSRTCQGLKEKLMEHSKRSGCHWNAPDDMQLLVVERAMRKKVCYADFDENDQMIDNTKVLAESSCEEDSEDDGAYNDMMLSRKKIGSPTRREPNEQTKSEPKKKKKRAPKGVKRGRTPSPSPKNEKRRRQTRISRMVDECLYAADDAEAKAADAAAAALTVREKLDDLAAELDDQIKD